MSTNGFLEPKHLNNVQGVKVTTGIKKLNKKNTRLLTFKVQAGKNNNMQSITSYNEVRKITGWEFIPDGLELAYAEKYLQHMTADEYKTIVSNRKKRLLNAVNPPYMYRYTDSLIEDMAEAMYENNETDREVIEYLKGGETQ